MRKEPMDKIDGLTVEKMEKKRKFFLFLKETGYCGLVVRGFVLSF